MSNIPKKNGNLLQSHLAFLQKSKERRRWSVASIPSSGYHSSTTPASSNSQCSLNTDDQYSCSCLHGTHHNNSNHSTHHVNPTYISPKLYHSGIAGTLAQHYSSNDSNPSLDEETRLLTLHFRPRSRSLSSPVRSPAILDSKSTLDSKSNLESATSKENLIHTPLIPGTLTFRRRSRSLSSPVRSPNVENRFVQMNCLYKERFPNAINQMNEKLEKFIQDNPELIPEVASDAVTRFVHHQAIEMAKDCLQKSKDESLTSHYFHEMSDGLEKLMLECKEKSSVATQHLKKLIKQLLLIVSRPARLLECLEFNPEEFYRFLEAAEGQAKTVQGIKTDLPQYIINKLGLNNDPLNEFKQLDEQIDERLNEAEERVHIDGKQIEQIEQAEPLKLPSEKDYETIKLISNGAYGAVYLVRHKETNQRYAMKKINKQNLMLRNQIEQAFAERDIMCFTDNPFVVSLFCSFETRNYLCMVMEYVEGGDCATLLKNMGPLPVDLAKFYFAEAVLAVEYLHSYGVIHRDLKPDNLLITALGHIKLTDFGLSKIGLMNLATNLCEGFIDKETKQFNDNQVCGTAEYIAPEVILRQGYGKPVDWWSMGIILYEFLIGMPPWSSTGDSTAEELFSHVINDEIEWPSDDDWPLPEEAKLIITQLLMPNPIDRLGTQGAHEVKEHPFFDSINWESLLRQKAEFVPQLSDEYDTSYFDTRLDRYNHELDDSEGLNDSDDSPLFSSFSSCSPRYHRMYSKIEKDSDDKPATKSSSTLSIMDDSNSRKSSAEEKEINKSLIKSSLSVEEPSISAKKEMKCKKDLNEELLSRLVGKDEKLFLNATPDSSQTESDDYSPLMQRRKKAMDKEMPKFNIEVPAKEEQQTTENVVEKRPLTPSIKETPPDDSATFDNESNSNEDNNSSLIYDENRLSLSTKTRPVIKSASASGLSQLLPEPAIKTQRRFTQPDNRHQLEESGGMFSDSTTSSIPDHSDINCRGYLNKSLLSRIDSPSKLSARNSLNVRKSSLRQMGSPYGSSASSRDNSPNNDLINKRKGSVESQNLDKRRSAADISLSSSFNNLAKLKPPVILKKSSRGYGFSFKAIRVYYGDSDVYTVHHLVMNVEPHSPAFEAGLKAGDLITHINGEPLQGLLHHQVLQLVLSAGELEIRTIPLEATSIKSGGRKRNPQVIKLARRAINRHHHSHRKSMQSSSLLSTSDQIPSAIQSIAPAVHSVLKRTDSDKRRKNSSLFRRLSSKRASADVQQFLTTSSCLANSDNTLLGSITPSKSFQYLSSNNEITPKSESTAAAETTTLKNNNNISTPTNQRTSANLTSHPLHHQCSISDSGSQSSSPNSSVPNSPATLTTCNLSICSNCSNVSTPLPSKVQQQQQQSMSAAQFNSRPNTLHGLKYKLVQTFRSPNNRRKSCGSISIPLSPLARSDRTNSPACASCLVHQQQQSNASPTRSPSPLASSNNSQPINHRHSHHFHRHRHSQLNCIQSPSSSCSNNCYNKQFIHQHTTVNINENASIDPITSLSSSTNPPLKKSICSSHCLPNRPACHSNLNDQDMYSIDNKSSSGHRSKSAEPDALYPTRRVSSADEHIYDNQSFLSNRLTCTCLKGKLSPLVIPSRANEKNLSLDEKSSIELKNENKSPLAKNEQQQLQQQQQSKQKISLENEMMSEKDSESSSSTSNCSVLNMNDKLNETIETIPECLNEVMNEDTGSTSKSQSESPSKKSNQQSASSSTSSSSSSSSNQESTFSKVKKSIGSPINIRKTLFKQNSEKRKASSFKSSKDNKEQKD